MAPAADADEGEEVAAAPARCQCRLGRSEPCPLGASPPFLPAGGARRSPDRLASVVCVCYRAAAVAVGHARPDSVEADVGETQPASLGTAVRVRLGHPRLRTLARVCGAYGRRMRCAVCRTRSGLAACARRSVSDSALTDRLAAVGARLAGSCESIALLIDCNGSDHYRRSATHRLSDTREAHLPVRALPKGSKRRLRACTALPRARFKVSKVIGLAVLHSNVLVRWVESSRRYFGGSRGCHQMLRPSPGFQARPSSVPSSNAKPRAGPLAWSAATMGATTALPGRPSRSRFPGRRRPCPSVPGRVACAWLPLAVGLPSRNRGGVDGGLGGGARAAPPRLGFRWADHPPGGRGGPAAWQPEHGCESRGTG